MTRRLRFSEIMDQLTPDQEDGGFVKDPQDEYGEYGERTVDGSEMGDFQGYVEGEEMFDRLKKKGRKQSADQGMADCDLYLREQNIEECGGQREEEKEGE